MNNVRRRESAQLKYTKSLTSTCEKYDVVNQCYIRCREPMSWANAAKTSDIVNQYNWIVPSRHPVLLKSVCLQLKQATFLTEFIPWQTFLCLCQRRRGSRGQSLGRTVQSLGQPTSARDPVTRARSPWKQTPMVSGSDQFKRLNFFLTNIVDTNNTHTHACTDTRAHARTRSGAAHTHKHTITHTRLLTARQCVPAGSRVECTACIGRRGTQDWPGSPAPIVNPPRAAVGSRYVLKWRGFIDKK